MINRQGTKKELNIKVESMIRLNLRLHSDHRRGETCLKSANTVISISDTSGVKGTLIQTSRRRGKGEPQLSLILIGKMFIYKKTKAT